MSVLSKMDIKVYKKNTATGFELLKGINRPVKPKHIQEMARSLDELGCIRPIIISKISFIDGVKKWYIIDGQHLYFALLKKDMDIPTLEVEVTDMADLVHTISVLNNTSASWSLEDYVKAWGNLANNKDYRRLQDYRKKYGMVYTTIAMALNTTLGSHGVLRYLKTGTFTIENEKLGTELLTEISEIRKFIPKGAVGSMKIFLSAFIKFYKTHRGNYNRAKMIKFVGENLFDITNTYSPSECYLLLSRCKM